MKSGAFAALAILAADRRFAAPETEGGVPPPHGWIGTTNEWIRGIGIIFALLNLVLLAVIWVQLRRGRVSTVSKALLFGAILVIPVVVVFLATANGTRESMTVEACGACHVMDGHVQDLQNPASDSLAAVHFKNRYIQENHCDTCHSDYGMYGRSARSSTVTVPRTSPKRRRRRNERSTRRQEDAALDPPGDRPDGAGPGSLPDAPL